VIYLDNAATTKPYPSVVERVAEVSIDDFGNPSAPYGLGMRAARILATSREAIAASLGCEPGELFFTSGGTEANNLAVRGVHLAALAADVGRSSLVTSTLEHPSVTKAVRDIRRQGYKVAYIDVRNGSLDMQALTAALRGDTVPRNTCALISLMKVQNVLGFVLPVEEAALLRDEYAPGALLHTDAVQAFGKMELRPGSCGIDLMSLSSHKIGGPRGIGALYVRKGTRIFTTAFGGGQEGGLRSGTEPVALAAGFAEAVRIAFARRKEYAAHCQQLRDRLLAALASAFPDVVVNSRPDGIPSCVHFSLPGLSNQAAVRLLSDQGIYVGISAACDANHIRPGEAIRKKHPSVLQLAGVGAALEKGSFRVSFSPDNSFEDIEAFVYALAQARAQLDRKPA
jgi:cysteine desulfurase